MKPELNLSEAYKDNQELLKELVEVEDNFNQIVEEIELKLKNINPEIKKFGQENFSEIISAFNEFKENLKLRFKLAFEIDRKENLPKAFEETKKILNLFASILESNLEDYKIENKFSDDKDLIYTRLNKRIVDAEKDIYHKIEIVFNSQDKKDKQARFKISFEDVFNNQEYSLRIDRDEEHGGVFIDLQTPAIDEVFSNIQDENGNWHHFKSKILTDEFLESQKFKKLVQIFKEQIVQVPEQGEFTIQDLVEKYNAK